MSDSRDDAAASEQNDGWPSLSSEAFLKTGIDVRTSSREGFLCKIRAKALIAMPASEVYEIFSLPDTTPMFRQIDETLARRVLPTSEASHNDVFVEQAATVGALFFKRRVKTALFVREFPEERASHFQLAWPGIMAAFEGFWALTPAPAAAFAAVPCAGDKGGRRHAQELTIFYLEQDVAPAIAQRIPQFAHGLLRRISAAAATAVVHDLNVISALRAAGVPLVTILCSLNVHGRNGLAQQYLSPGAPAYRPPSADEMEDTDGGPAEPCADEVTPGAAADGPTEWRGLGGCERERAELRAGLEREVAAAVERHASVAPMGAGQKMASHSVSCALSDDASSGASLKSVT